MSSGTSTDEVRLKPDTTYGEVPGVPLQADQSLHPWQFFLLAGLGCATAVVFVARGQGVTTVLLLSVLMATAVLVGLAALRMLRPLVTGEDDRTPMVGHRTRVALEREKALVLRSIKELEFDRAMGKVSESDWRDMSGRLRARAAGLMRQLDAGSGYREQIERDLDARLKPRATNTGDRRADSGDRSSKASAERTCANCQTVNDPDARFCNQCGQRL
jgi:Double zinc ribbon